MNDATPPPIPPIRPVAPKKPFTLPKALFVLWAIFFAVMIYLAVSVQHLDAFSLGQLSGQFLARTLFSLAVSWVAWRLARRSDWVKSTVFTIVFLVFALDTLAGLGVRRRYATPAAITAVQEEARRAQRAQIEEFQETGTISRNTQAMNQIITTMRKSASQGTDLERKLMAGMTDFTEKLRDADAMHANSSEAMDAEWILQPKTPKSPAEIQTLASAVTNFLRANENLLTLFTNSSAIITQELKSQGVPTGAIVGAVDGFQSGFKPQAPFIKKLRQQDADYGQALLGILDLYKTEHGKWKWDEESELVAFESETNNQRWLDLIDKINEIATDQQQTQAELIDLRAKVLARQQK
jgi:hypothetical protein